MNKIKLKDATVKITDGSHFSPQGVEIGYPMLSSKDMRDNGFDYSDVKHITKDDYLALVKNGCKPKIDDVLIIKDGNSYLKKAFVVTEEADIVLLSSIGILRPNKRVIDPYFLKYYLLSDYVQNAANKYVTGSAIPRVILANFGEIEIPLPSMQEQKKIALVLKTLDAKMAVNNAIAAELEGVAKDLYDYWFVQFDFPDENGKPYKSSGGKMVWNEELKREIPEGWEVDRLGKHITSSRGISYNSATLEGDGVPMINLASFGVDSNYKPAGIKTYNGQYDADKILHPFDLIMCNTQQTAIDPTKDIIGKAMLVPDIFDGDIVSSHHVTTITPDVDELKYYLYGTCKTTWFHKYIVGFASGTNILGLDFKGFEDYLMLLPPMRFLQKFATSIKNIESEKNLIITENAELASLRDFLLPMLMNGQVKVKGAS